MKKREDLIPAVEILNYLEDSFIVGWPQYFSPLNPLWKTDECGVKRLSYK